SVRFGWPQDGQRSETSPPGGSSGRRLDVARLSHRQPRGVNATLDASRRRAVLVEVLDREDPRGRQPEVLFAERPEAVDARSGGQIGGESRPRLGGCGRRWGSYV